MLEEYFAMYLKNKALSDATVKKYVGVLNKIDREFLDLYDDTLLSIYDIENQADLTAFKDALFSNDDFIRVNTTGNNMYSCAVNHYYNFAIEDEKFFEENIERMDIKQHVPMIRVKKIKTYIRNNIVVEQALIGAHHMCELDSRHKTFISQNSGKQYMEGHHIIPLKMQENFNTSLDVYANIVCVCPVCHRLLHYGTTDERLYRMDQLYEMRSERLINSGIDISRTDFRKIAEI